MRKHYLIATIVGQIIITIVYLGVMIFEAVSLAQYVMLSVYLVSFSLMLWFGMGGFSKRDKLHKKEC